jgi:glyoxylase-like metal-dependent hydrolase (beta-lactamase superfamily II)
MKRFVYAALATALALFALPAAAQTPPPAAAAPDYAAVVIKTTDLGHNTYELEGLGGNMTVAVTPAGVILVDSEFAPLHEKIKAAIAALSAQPVKFVINTHYHGDHTGGDAAFAGEGATIVAHLNVKNRLIAPAPNALTGAVPPAFPVAGLPARTYTDAPIAVELGGRSARVAHIANAHTDGDSYVYYADANVLATGDIVTLGRFPNIDVANGGNINGMIAGADAYIALANDATKIVPGHGPLTNKAGVIAYRAMLASARERVAALIASGKSEADAVAAAPLADIQAKLGADATAAANFTRLVYRSLKPAS